MNQDLIVGLLALGVPLFGVGYLMLRQNTGVFRMFIAMLLIGLGYLTATGALTDIGRTIMAGGALVAPVEAPAVTTVPATEAPAPAAGTPAPAEPTPAEDASGEPPPEEPAASADDVPPSEGEPPPPPAPANP